MSKVTTNGGHPDTDMTDSARLDFSRRGGFRRIGAIVCFGCLPGVISGLLAGVLLGIFAWEFVDQQGAMNPLEGLDVPAGRQSLSTIHATVDALSEAHLHDQGSMGLAIGVVRGEESAVWCYGRSAVSDTQPVDGDTLFELASVGKTFTALVLADMDRSGDIRLNDRLEQHLPEGVAVPALNETEITLLDLATQTSGLPSLPPDFEFGDPLNPYKDYTAEKMFSSLRSIRLTRPPGSAYEYSNLGFGLLGQALAQSAGTSYEQLVVDRICTPLGMNRTRMTLTDELRTNLATPHDGGSAVPIWEDTTMPGAGSFLSTASDMLRYLKLFLHPSPDSSNPLAQAALATSVKRRPGDHSARSMGLAWHIDSENAHDIVWHNGGAGGSCSYAAFTVAPRCGVIVLSNSSNPVDELGIKTLYLLLQSD